MQAARSGDVPKGPRGRVRSGGDPRLRQDGRGALDFGYARDQVLMVARALLFSVVLTGLVGCGEEEEASKTPPAKATPKSLTLQVASLPRKSAGPAITVRGLVTPGAWVTVGKLKARVRRGRFRIRIRLKVGINDVKITARKPGYRIEHQRVQVKRSSPPPSTGGKSQPEPSGCPPGQVDRQGMEGAHYCGPPVPTSCPPGQYPVQATASCEPFPSAEGGSESSDPRDRQCGVDPPPCSGVGPGDSDP